MNNSIYKKQSAFKSSLPQYRDGGKKFAAGLAGFATKIPMLGQVVDPMISNTKLAKEYDTAFNAGQMAGGVANTVANAAVGNVPGAISAGADTMQEGLEMGSSIASNNNNTERAKRLTGAAQGFGAVEGISGMFNTSQFGQGTQMFGGMGNIPIEMKYGGSIPKYPDGGTLKERQARADSLYSPIRNKLMETANIITSDEFDINQTLRNNYTQIHKFSGDVASMPVDSSRNPPPMDNVIKEIQTKIQKLTPEQAKTVLSTNFKSNNPLNYIKLLKEVDVSIPEILKYKKHFTNLKEQGYTFKNGGILNQYNNGGNLIKYNLPTYEDGAIHKGTPTAELELKENGLNGNGEPFQVNAPSHEKGGVKVNLKEGAKILSDNKDLFGKNTPAKEAAPLIKRLKQLENRKDNISENTKQIYEKKINNIFQEQEQFKEMAQAKSNPFKMKNGGKLPKYFNGGATNWWEQPLGSGTVDSFSTIPTESMNTKSNLGIPFVDNNKTVVPPTPTPDWLTKAMTGKTTADEIFDVSKTSNTDNLARTQATQRRLSNPLNTTTNTTTPNQQLTLGDKMQLGAEGAAGLALLGMGMKKPEVYKPLTSPLFGSGLADMNQNVRFNTNPILMNRNVGANQINQGSTSDAVRRANLQSLFRGTNTQLGEMAEREALANAQIKQQLGQAKIGVGQQDVAAQEKARLMSAEARAAAQNLRAQGLQTLFGAASNVGKGMNVRQGNTIKMNVLNSLAGQYGVDPKTLEIIFKEQGITTIK